MCPFPQSASIWTRAQNWSCIWALLLGEPLWRWRPLSPFCFGPWEIDVTALDLTEREELLVVALGDINHQLLCALWELAWKQTCRRRTQKWSGSCQRFTTASSTQHIFCTSTRFAHRVPTHIHWQQTCILAKYSMKIKEQPFPFPLLTG